MKTASLFFLITAALFAQGKQNNTWTGLVDASGARFIPPAATFASPPSSPQTGAVFIFTDASATGVCAGGGSALALCRYSGSGYVATSGSGSGSGPVCTAYTYGATPTFTVSTSTIQAFDFPASACGTPSAWSGNVASSTLTATSATAGQEILFNICTDGSARTFVFPSNVTGAGTVGSELNVCYRQMFKWDGTNAVAKSAMTCPACSPAVTIPGSSSGQSAVVAPATGGGTVTLFAGSDTVVGKATTDTLTNKTLDTAGTGNTFKINGASVTDKTGTGKAVLDTAPTLSNPVVGTQSANDNSTKAASTAYADAAAGARSKVLTLPIGCVVGDPAGSALATGVLCYITVPTAGTIVGWDLVVDAGTATVDVWKIATGTAKPTVTNTITASAKPAISTGTAIHSTTLTGWSTGVNVSANDILGFNLDAVATAKYITVNIQVQF